MQRRGRKGASPHRCFFPSSQDLRQSGVGAVNFSAALLNLYLSTQGCRAQPQSACSGHVRLPSFHICLHLCGRRLFVKRCDTAARPAREPSSQVYPYKNFGIPLCQEQIATRVRGGEAWKDALTARRGRHKQQRHFADHTQQEGLQYRVRRLVFFVLERKAVLGLESISACGAINHTKRAADDHPLLTPDATIGGQNTSPRVRLNDRQPMYLS